jgi:hypothetical protein
VLRTFVTQGHAESSLLDMESRERAAAMQAAVNGYRNSASPFYDEVVYEVSRRADTSGSIGKADIGALVLWKRLNANTPWAADLMETAEDGVRAATAAARQAALDEDQDVPSAARQARAALSSLPGFGVGDALASAVIHALAPNRMAVYDRRAQLGLERLGLVLTPKAGRYGRYMALVGQLMADAKMSGTELSAREVDLALFTLGGRADPT